MRSRSCRRPVLGGVAASVQVTDVTDIADASAGAALRWTQVSPAGKSATIGGRASSDPTRMRGTGDSGDRSGRLGGAGSAAPEAGTAPVESGSSAAELLGLRGGV